MLFIALVLQLIVYLYIKVASKKIWIQDDKIFIQLFGKKAVDFGLHEIKEIRWSARAVGRNSRGVGRRRGDEVQIHFGNGDVLEFGINEYSNFDEMRAWFLNFGKERGLLTRSGYSSIILYKKICIICEIRGEAGKQKMPVTTRHSLNQSNQLFNP